jgi:hypothetical protein
MVNDLKVNYRLLGTDRTRQQAVFPWSYLDDHFAETDFVRQESNIHVFDFLVADKSTGELFIKPGEWELDQSLIIPQGYHVIAGEGVQLNLSKSATILSYSALKFSGSEDQPIVIQSADSTGQGIIVMNVEETSHLEYVTFEGLSNPSQHGWELTGAVTFYEAPVAISHSRFVANRSEDALNIVGTEFWIHHTLFSETSSDALDADFCTGMVTDSSFYAIGGDAIDASGSVIEMWDVFINGSGDKGLSVGEGSQVTANRIDIAKARIAVASKDSSHVVVHDVRISQSEIGLAAYQKKPEFGPASMEVNRSAITDVKIPYLVELRSAVLVDGAVIEGSQENVYETLYGGGSE